MVLSFGITGYLFAINFIAFWGVASCNVVDYVIFIGEFVTWAACNSVMYFDLCSSPLYKLSHSNSPEVTYKKGTVKKISMEANFLKHESLEIGLVNCAYLLHLHCM